MQETPDTFPALPSAEVLDVLYRPLTEAVLVFVCSANPEHEPGEMMLHYANPRARRILRISRGAVRGQRPLSKMTSPSQFAIACAVRDTGQTYEEKVYLQITPTDGVWLHGRLTRIPGGIIAVFEDITAIRATERQLEDLSVRFENAISHQPVVLYTYHPDGTILLAEGRGLTELGFTRTDLINQNIYSIYGKHPDLVEHLRSAADGYDQQFRATISGHHFEITLTPVRKPDGRTAFVAGSALNITTFVLAERATRRAVSVFRESHEGILIMDRSFRILDVNPAFLKLTGYEAEDVLGKILRDITLVTFKRKLIHDIAEGVRATGRYSGEVLMGKKTGGYVDLSVTIVRTQEDPESPGYIALVDDISERKAYEKQIWYAANYDPLTNLPNRTLFAERIASDIRSISGSGEQLAVISIDLDNFKFINDRFGHAAGDELLKIMAQRFESACEYRDTLARFGGDEFVLLRRFSGERSSLTGFLESLVSLACEPVQLNGGVTEVTISVGVAIYPEHAESFMTLYQCSDAALYQAKSSGKNQFSFFSGELQESMAERIALESRLRRVVERNELFLLYQPIVDAHTGRIAGAEALLRWRTNDGSVLSPHRFLPYIQESPILDDIENWVLHSALVQAEALRDIPDFFMAVNLTARKFSEGNLSARLERLLLNRSLKPSRLHIEITEAVLVTDLIRTSTILSGLRQLGIRIAIDDFGTGYSSLSYLHQFAVDSLKIDRSFMSEISSADQTAPVIDSIIGLANALHVSLIAEGVENQMHREFCTRKGIAALQGFLFSLPLPPGELRELLTAGSQNYPDIP